MAFVQQMDSCVSVGSVFGTDRRLFAPLYQRTFAWDKKNLNAFWDDVKLVEEGQSETLFLGAIILKHEKASNPSAGNLEEFLVLDGQQRITTLYLTLLAIALEWQDREHQSEAETLAENYLVSNKRLSRGQPRFFPTIPDTPEFASLCRMLKVIDWDLPSGTNAKTGKMSAAFDTARRQVRYRCETDDGFDEEALRELEITLVDKIEIATINIADRHQPNEVFNRLNRRGKDLTVGDLVKNEIFRPLAADPATAKRLYDEHWDPFEKIFGDKKLLDNYYYPFTLSINSNATVAGAFDALRLLERKNQG